MLQFSIKCGANELSPFYCMSTTGAFRGSRLQSHAVLSGGLLLFWGGGPHVTSAALYSRGGECRLVGEGDMLQSAAQAALIPSHISAQTLTRAVGVRPQCIHVM